MPKIRSITYFADILPSFAEQTITQAGQFLNRATEAFEHAGFTVQTRRLASQPFPQWTVSVPDLVSYIKTHFDDCQQNEIAYWSIGPVGATDDPAYVDVIADIFRAIPGVFASVNIADLQHGISLPHLDHTAALIDILSRITADGMTNLYLAAIANCRPGSPFFPVAYHGGGPAKFALAIQAADLAVDAFQGAISFKDARHRLTTAIQVTADKLVQVAEKLAIEYEFSGIDFSLAPYPVDSESLGGALESLGPIFGGAGLVASASLIMNAIEAANFPSVGFSGLMLPILEDSVLAARTAQGLLSINDLLLLSTICGTGLDCIPLPGDVTIAVLRDILLDVASLALRLNKPLTARLMPFPTKKAGDDLMFEFEFFAPSKVLPAPMPSLLNFDDTFHIRPR